MYDTVITLLGPQTVTYDAAKTNGRNIQAAMKNIGYDTKVVSDTYMDGGKQKEAKKK